MFGYRNAVQELQYLALSYPHDVAKEIVQKIKKKTIENIFKLTYNSSLHTEKKVI